MGQLQDSCLILSYFCIYSYKYIDIGYVMLDCTCILHDRKLEANAKLGLNVIEDNKSTPHEILDPS